MATLGGNWDIGGRYLTAEDYPELARVWDNPEDDIFDTLDQQPTPPTGICPKCRKPLDDHDGWFSKDGLTCPKKESNALHDKASG